MEMDEIFKFYFTYKCSVQYVRNVYKCAMKLSMKNYIGLEPSFPDDEVGTAKLFDHGPSNIL